MGDAMRLRCAVAPRMRAESCELRYRPCASDKSIGHTRKHMVRASTLRAGDRVAIDSRFARVDTGGLSRGRLASVADAVHRERPCGGQDADGIAIKP